MLQQKKWNKYGGDTINLPTTRRLQAVGTVHCWLAYGNATCASFCIFCFVSFERAIGDPIWIWDYSANGFWRVAVVILAAYTAEASTANDSCTTEAFCTGDVLGRSVRVVADWERCEYAIKKAAPPENPMSADRVKWEHIHRVFELCNRNVSETARRLKMHRRTLQRILSKRSPK